MTAHYYHDSRLHYTAEYNKDTVVPVTRPDGRSVGLLVLNLGAGWGWAVSTLPLPLYAR